VEHGDHVLDALPAAAEPGAGDQPRRGAFPGLLGVELIGAGVELGSGRRFEAAVDTKARDVGRPARKSTFVQGAG
jgi:hypothetical protein